MPVYNGEKSLHKAVGSILTQTFSDFEFIIVENGSKDNSHNIAKAYEAVFPNVRVFRSEPRGVSRARNIGLENAKGRYIVFLDADDYYVPIALETMHASLMQCDADILIGGMLNYPMIEDGSLVLADPWTLYLELLDPPMYRTAIIGEENVRRAEFASRHQCARAYKRSFIEDEGLRFDERCTVWVDFLFNKAAYAAAKRPYLLYKRLYKYNTVSGSLTHRSGAALIRDTVVPFSITAKQIDAPTVEERSAHIYAAFMMLVSMLGACAAEYSAEAHETLLDVLATNEAKTVVSEVRSSNLHLLPHKDELLQKLLVMLKNDDIGGVLHLMNGSCETR